VVLLAVIVKVIEIVNGLPITRVVGVRLPGRGGFVMLAAWGSGGGVMTAEEVTSTEDADRELLAGSVGAGGVAGEGSKKSKLRVKGSKVKWDMSVINWEEH
jgi:hypothetical protein